MFAIVLLSLFGGVLSLTCKEQFAVVDSVISNCTYQVNNDMLYALDDNCSDLCIDDYQQSLEFCYVILHKSKDILAFSNNGKYPIGMATELSYIRKLDDNTTYEYPVDFTIKKPPDSPTCRAKFAVITAITINKGINIINPNSTCECYDCIPCINYINNGSTLISLDKCADLSISAVYKSFDTTLCIIDINNAEREFLAFSIIASPSNVVYGGIRVLSAGNKCGYGYSVNIVKE